MGEHLATIDWLMIAANLIFLVAFAVVTGRLRQNTSQAIE